MIHHIPATPPTASDIISQVGVVVVKDPSVLEHVIEEGIGLNALRNDGLKIVALAETAVVVVMITVYVAAAFETELSV